MPYRLVSRVLQDIGKALLTFNRYSIALSPLKKAARIAKSICERSKPIDSISAICAALSAPIARPPLDDVGAGVSKAGVAPDPAPAGDGVAGTLLATELAGWAGAAGGAGVDATAGAGVEGAFDAEAVEAGAALG